MESYAFYRIKDYIFKIGHNGKAVLSIDVVDSMSESSISDISELAYTQLTEYFDKKRQVFDFAMELKGTEFQQKVWQALRQIPYGQTRTYKDIAIAINSPKSCRAVGGANNKNPILIAVPCHRVIGTSQKLVGFGAGIHMKKALLDLEGSKYKD